MFFNPSGNWCALTLHLIFQSNGSQFCSEQFQPHLPQLLVMQTLLEE